MIPAALAPARILLYTRFLVHVSISTSFGRHGCLNENYISLVNTN